MRGFGTDGAELTGDLRDRLAAHGGPGGFFLGVGHAEVTAFCTAERHAVLVLVRRRVCRSPQYAGTSIPELANTRVATKLPQDLACLSIVELDRSQDHASMNLFHPRAEAAGHIM
ncbi:hypothetical protein, partial [Thermoactinospora rubra]|uniref:hypothetical protein n=1 Tax=Thermoactinospora rubra TaxID=1088767 RepID=UPI00197CF14E